MKQLVIAAAFLVVGVFSAESYAKLNRKKKPSVGRQVAQVKVNPYEDAEEIIAAFDTRAEAGDKEALAMMNDYMQRLLKIYVRTDALVKQFDKDLASGENPMNTNNYKDIQAYYALHKRLTNRISSFHRYLTDVEGNKSPMTDARKQNAKAALNSFYGKLKEMSAVEKIAFQEIFQRISMNVSNSMREHAKIKNNPTREERVVAERLRSSNLNTQRITDILKSSDYKNGLTAETTKVEETKSLPEMGGTLDKEFEVVRSKIELSDGTRSRSPQSTIKPSPGADGMVNGSTFPEGTWAFTYDDGPNATHTKTIMDVFNQHKKKATFFWLSQITSQSGMASTIAAVKSGGHEMASHSHSHANLSTLGDAGLKREINDAQVLHASAFGYAPKFYRCPYGACGSNGSNIRQRIANENMIMAFWNVDSLDWQDRNPQSVVNRVKQQMRNQKRGIVLMHDIHATTATATQILIPELIQEGMVTNFVTMSEAIN